MSDTPEEVPSEPQEQEFSLRALSEAFAEALSRAGGDRRSPDGELPSVDRQSVPEPAAEVPEQQAPESDEQSDQDDCCPISPRTILEAMLFVGDPENRPLEREAAASLMRDVEAEDIPVLVDELNQSYRQSGCPYRITSDAAGFRLTLGEKHYRVRERFYGRIRRARLSRAAIDVLAIVAYRQPLGADEVSRLRDKPSHHILSQLVRRRLLRVERAAEKPRKALYRTTDRFLELFELGSLADLPESEALDHS